jgi:general secretion pathway protein F
MPDFRYLAVSATGELQRGIMTAPDATAVIERLRRQGSTPMRADPANRESVIGRLLHADIGRGQRLRRQEVADLTRELATMLAVGQDLDRALQFMVEIAANARCRAVLEALRDVVRNGGSLAEAMAQQQRSFPPLYVGLIRAGEAGGTLAATLDHVATMLERQQDLAATLQSAMVYPMVLLVAAIGSIALLLTEVLPQFVPLFQQSGTALPRPTRILMAIGDFVSNDGIYVLLALAASLWLLRQALRVPGTRLVAERLVLYLPIAGNIVREVLSARLTRTLGTLLLNGVPLIAALGITRDALGNLAAEAAVDGAIQSVKSGAGLAAPLERAGIFPPRAIHLLRLGEETARLGPMALRAAGVHEAQVHHQVQRLMALLGPAITIVMGAAIAGTFASLMLAMLSLNEVAGY